MIEGDPETNLESDQGESQEIVAYEIEREQTVVLKVSIPISDVQFLRTTAAELGLSFGQVIRAVLIGFVRQNRDSSAPE